MFILMYVPVYSISGYIFGYFGLFSTIHIWIHVLNEDIHFFKIWMQNRVHSALHIHLNTSSTLLNSYCIKVHSHWRRFITLQSRAKALMHSINEMWWFNNSVCNKASTWISWKMWQFLLISIKERNSLAVYLAKQ